MTLHVCSNVKANGKYTGFFLCSACSFAGKLEEAVKHTTENQFIVETKPRKIKSSWLKNNNRDNWTER